MDIRLIDNELRLYRKDSYKSFFEVSFRWSLPFFTLCLEEDPTENDISLGLLCFNFYFRVPFLKFLYRKKDRFSSELQYGFYFFKNPDEWLPDSFWICHGSESFVIYMPWTKDLVRYSFLGKDGIWLTPEKLHGDIPDEHLWSEVHDYSYTLEGGEVQSVKATIKVSNSEWRQKWLKWTRAFACVKQYIDVEFSEEVGEETGTWKGGVVGASHIMLPNETPLECFRRMEKEEKF